MFTITFSKFAFRIPAPPIGWMFPNRDRVLEDVFAKADDRLLADAGTTRSEAMGLNRFMWAELRRSRGF